MQQHHGFTFSEVLVCLILLSIMLSCMHEIQYVALREAKSAFYGAIAIEHINSILDQSQSMPEQKNASLINWDSYIKKNLPRGEMQLTQRGSHYQLGIVWGHKNTLCKSNRMGLSGCIILKDIF